MRLRRWSAAGALALLALASFGGGHSEAKTPGYVITGGDLGDYAMHFFTDDYIEMSNDEMVEEPPPTGPLEAPYLLYSSWPFGAAAELADGQPLAYLYAHERLVLNPWSGAWLRLSDKMWDGEESWSGVGKAIAKAKDLRAQGKLDNGAVLAALTGRGYDQATWDAFAGNGTTVLLFPPEIPHSEAGSAFYRGGPDPRVGPDGSPAIRITAAQFPLHALADSLGTAPAAEQALPEADDLTFLLNASGPTSGGGTFQTPNFLYYSPPTGSRSGLIWEGRPDAPQRAWASTARFDLEFAAALRAGAAAQRARATAQAPFLQPAPANEKHGRSRGGFVESLVVALAVGGVASAAWAIRSRRRRRGLANAR